MTSPVLWTLIASQLALGLFDILYHHEMTEGLAWRPSQRQGLRLHGARNLAYAATIALGSPAHRSSTGTRSARMAP